MTPGGKACQVRRASAPALRPVTHWERLYPTPFVLRVPHDQLVQYDTGPGVRYTSLMPLRVAFCRMPLYSTSRCTIQRHLPRFSCCLLSRAHPGQQISQRPGAEMDQWFARPVLISISQYFSILPSHLIGGGTWTSSRSDPASNK